MTDAIGQFEFLYLAGNVEPIKEQLLVLARPGVDGLAFWKQGIRGQPFALRSGIDCPSHTIAEQLMAYYVQLIGDDPVELVMAGVNYSELGAVFKVLDVRKAALRGIAFDVGGMNSPQSGSVPKALLECDWLLTCVPVPEETSP